MARIRSVHPGQWTDERFVTCSPLARLLALGVRNEADDNGIFEWKPLTLKMRLFPADSCEVGELLHELEETDQVYRFSVDGKEYGLIRNFTKYQRPKKPTFTYPTPTEPLPHGYELHPAYFRNDEAPGPGEHGNEEETGGDSSGEVPNQCGTGGGNAPQREGRGREGEEKNPAEEGSSSGKPAGAVQIDTFIHRCKESGEKVIPEGDAVFRYAEEVGLPLEYVRLAYREFVERNRARKKRYKDWRQAFQNCVRENWYRLWWADNEGNFHLTTNGVQAQKAEDATRRDAA